MEHYGKKLKFRPINYVLILLIRIYQITISPLIRGNCRFYPTCSNYSIESFQRFSFIKGFFLTTRRLLKCHPFGNSGYDPVIIEDQISIKKISLRTLKKFRNQELYSELPKKLSKYDGDLLKNTRHFALFKENKVISAVTLIESKESTKTLQLRGMFTRKEFIRKGFGKTLIEFVIKDSKKKKYKILWCNSRKSAISFYKKFGFSPKGSFFLVKHLGLHMKLVKYLKDEK